MESDDEDASKLSLEEEEEDGFDWDMDDDDEDISDPSRGPTTWADVDEDELRSVAFNLSLVGISTIQGEEGRLALPTSTQQDHKDVNDPLGLGKLDVNAGVLASKRRSSNLQGSREMLAGSSRNRRASFRLAPGANRLGGLLRGGLVSSTDAPTIVKKSLPTQEEFDPSLYLARVHKDTSAVQLEFGLETLRTTMSDNTRQLRELVKDHFERFISCKNVIDDIHVRLQRSEVGEGGGAGQGTSLLASSVGDVQAAASAAFGPLLERQAEVERVRRVLGVLRRLQSLFSLPARLKEHIQRGEYEQVIREYRRAKAMIEPTSVSLLHKLLEEVDQGVAELRSQLLGTLEDPHLPPAQAERTIRQVMELGSDDRLPAGASPANPPAADRRRRASVGAGAGRLGELAQIPPMRPARRHPVVVWLGALEGSAVGQLRAVEGRHKVELATIKREGGGSGARADAHLRAVRAATEVVLANLPIMWGLPEAIMGGRAAIRVTSLSRRRGREDQGGAGINTDEVVVETAVHKSTSQVVRTCAEVVDRCMGLLKTAPSTDPWLEGAVEAVADCHHAIAIAKAPTAALRDLDDLRRRSASGLVKEVCRQLEANCRTAVSEEDWVMVPSARLAAQGGKVEGISSLPSVVKALLESAMAKVERAEIDSEDREEAAGRVRGCLRDTLAELAEGMRVLADDVKLGKTGQDPTDPRSRRHQMVVRQELRVLMLLSNCCCVREQVVPAIEQKYGKLWAKSARDGPPRMDTAALKDVEEELLDQYMSAKLAALRPAVQEYMFSETTDWSAAPPVVGVRDSALQLLHASVVSVHAEVSGGAAPFAQRIVEGVLAALLQELYDTVRRDVKSLDQNGLSQLYLEVDFIEAALRPFCGAQHVKALEMLHGALLEKLAPPEQERGVAGEAEAHAREAEMEARRVSARRLPRDLERARLNVRCFRSGTAGLLRTGAPRASEPSNPRDAAPVPGGRGDPGLQPPPPPARGLRTNSAFADLGSSARGGGASKAKATTSGGLGRISRFGREAGADPGGGSSSSPGRQRRPKGGKAQNLAPVSVVTHEPEGPPSPPPPPPTLQEPPRTAPGEATRVRTPAKRYQPRPQGGEGDGAGRYQYQPRTVRPSSSAGGAASAAGGGGGEDGEGPGSSSPAIAGSRRTPLSRPTHGGGAVGGGGAGGSGAAGGDEPTSPPTTPAPAGAGAGVGAGAGAGPSGGGGGSSSSSSGAAGAGSGGGGEGSSAAKRASFRARYDRDGGSGGSPEAGSGGREGAGGASDSPASARAPHTSRYSPRSSNGGSDARRARAHETDAGPAAARAPFMSRYKPRDSNGSSDLGHTNGSPNAGASDATAKEVTPSRTPYTSRYTPRSSNGGSRAGAGAGGGPAKEGAPTRAPYTSRYTPRSSNGGSGAGAGAGDGPAKEVTPSRTPYTSRYQPRSSNGGSEAGASDGSAGAGAGDGPAKEVTPSRTPYTSRYQPRSSNGGSEAGASDGSAGAGAGDGPAKEVTPSRTPYTSRYQPRGGPASPTGAAGGGAGAAEGDAPTAYRSRYQPRARSAPQAGGGEDTGSWAAGGGAAGAARAPYSSRYQPRAKSAGPAEGDKGAAAGAGAARFQPRLRGGGAGGAVGSGGGEQPQSPRTSGGA